MIDDVGDNVGVGGYVVLSLSIKDFFGFFSVGKGGNEEEETLFALLLLLLVLICFGCLVILCIVFCCIFAVFSWCENYPACCIKRRE